MEAGRELDALVAEKVMGRKVRYVSPEELDQQYGPWIETVEKDGSLTPIPRERGIWLLEDYSKEGDGIDIRVPIFNHPCDHVRPYSTDLACAFNVINTLKQHYHEIKMEYIPEQDYWVVSGGVGYKDNADGPLPLAICRMALMLVKRYGCPIK